MKKCSYCGQENPDEATLCAGCGQREFKSAAPPRIEPLQTSENNVSLAPKHLLLRFLIAAGVWVIISGVSLWVSWQQSNDSAGWYEQHKTQKQLEAMGQAISVFQQRNHFAPTNFVQLQVMTNEVLGMQYLFGMGFTDGWERPFIFTNEGINCLIISYGRDGKPGGDGVDHDLTTAEQAPAGSAPTFGQFYSNKRMQGMIGSSYFCGGLAAVLSLLTVRIPNLNKRGIVILGLSLGATLVGTFFVTSIITVLHIPSGH